MAALLIALIIFGLYIYLKDTIKSDTNDSYEESSKAQSSSNFQSSTFYFEDVVVDAFIAVVKLTPDLHVLGDGVKERMKEYAYNTLKKIDGPAGEVRTSRFANRINQREQIKVKELEKKVSDKLKYYDFQYKKEILICMWSLAYADGQATLDQQKLISIIGKAMGLPYTTCNKIETMFWQRMKAGKFGDYKEFEKRRNKWFEDEAERKAEKEFEKKRKENSNTNYSNSRKTNYSNLSPELQKAYSVLGIEPSASIDEIKNQKKKLLKRYHPDLFANQGEDMIKKATKKAQSINHAYEIIMKNV
ncbi:MAG: DnaJ domain-containing protein [Bacteroidales bacterium]|nr:DnaJ domain-containing protein [Bacteroidales bacterium]